MDNKLAHFKAKYGASNTMMASLLQADLDSVRDWAARDTTPPYIDTKIDALDRFVARMISEGKLLGDQAPIIQVLEHNAGVMARENEGLSTSITVLSHKIKLYEGLNFWGRLVFLFSPKPKNVAVLVRAEHG